MHLAALKNEVSPHVLAGLRSLGAPVPIPKNNSTWFNDSRVANTGDIEADLLSVLNIELDAGFEEDSDHWLVVHAWRMLAQRRVEAAIPLLVELLINVDDEDEWTLDEIPDVLATFGPVAVAPLLKLSVKSRPTERVCGDSPPQWTHYV